MLEQVRQTEKKDPAKFLILRPCVRIAPGAISFQLLSSRYLTYRSVQGQQKVNMRARKELRAGALVCLSRKTRIPSKIRHKMTNPILVKSSYLFCDLEEQVNSESTGLAKAPEHA